MKTGGVEGLGMKTGGVEGLGMKTGGVEGLGTRLSQAIIKNVRCRRPGNEVITSDQIREV